MWLKEISLLLLLMRAHNVSFSKDSNQNEIRLWEVKKIESSLFWEKNRKCNKKWTKLCFTRNTRMPQKWLIFSTYMLCSNYIHLPSFFFCSSYIDFSHSLNHPFMHLFIYSWYFWINGHHYAPTQLSEQISL